MDSETIAAIQRAGQAVQQAQSILAGEAGNYATVIAQAMSSDAFSVDNDARFEEWKSVARMAQTLASFNEQLKQVYFAAGEIAMGGGTGKPSKVLALAAPSQSGAVDVVARSVDDARPPKAREQRRVKMKTPKRVAPSNSVVSASGVKGNAGRVLDFLMTKLNAAEPTRLTQSEIAAGSSVALGSVGFAVSSLKNKGRLEEVDRGSYRLR